MRPNFVWVQGMRCHITWSNEAVQLKCAEFKAERLAWSTGQSCEIYMPTHLPHDFERSVLVHELLHLCFYYSGYQDEDAQKVKDPEEYTIGLIDDYVLSIMRNNPDLQAYLIENEEGIVDA